MIRKQKTKSKSKSKRGPTAEQKKYELSNYLIREIRYGNITRKRHENEWREITMKIAFDDAQKQLEYSREIFEWALDLKDFKISFLLDELDKVNVQSIFAEQKHCFRINSLLNDMMKNLTWFNEDYKKSLEEMENYHEDLMKVRKNGFTYQSEPLKTQLYHLEYRHIENSKYLFNKHMVEATAMEREVEEENKYRSLIAGNIMLKIWKKLNNIFNNYSENFEKTRREIQRESVALEIAVVDIKRNFKKLNYLVELIGKLSSKVRLLESTIGERLRQLLSVQEEFSGYLFIMKNNVVRDTRLDDAKQKLVVVTANETRDYFNSALRRGLLLTGLMRHNKRYETSREKVMPYPKEEKSGARQRHQAGMIESLNLFYRKMAYMESSRIALAEEKKVLELENYLLTKKLEKYCSCIECTNRLKKLEKKAKITKKSARRRTLDLSEIIELLDKQEEEENFRQIFETTKNEVNAAFPKITDDDKKKYGKKKRLENVKSYTELLTLKPSSTSKLSIPLIEVSFPDSMKKISLDQSYKFTLPGSKHSSSSSHHPLTRIYRGDSLGRKMSKNIFSSFQSDPLTGKVSNVRVDKKDSLHNNSPNLIFPSSQNILTEIYGGESIDSSMVLPFSRESAKNVRFNDNNIANLSFS